MTNPAFGGFPKETFAFLKGLAEHNEKGWFEAHRADYDAHFIAPAKAFVTAMGAALAKPFPQVRAEPRVNGTIRRINRDIRFSADKRPYHPTLRFHFQGANHGGLYLWMDEGEAHLGAGIYEFTKGGLEHYRKQVDAESSGKALVAAVKKVEGAGYTLHGEHYKRVPRGYAADHPRARFLLHTGLFAGTSVPRPSEALTGDFIGFCLAHFKRMAPLHQWLAEVKN